MREISANGPRVLPCTTHRSAPTLVHQQRRLENQAAIDAAHAHDDHQQQADAHGGQREAAHIVADVTDGEVHGRVMR